MTMASNLLRGLEVLPLIQAGDAMQVKIIRLGRAARSFRADATTFARLVARAPRLAAPYFSDPDELAAGEQPWYVKNLETKLANLQRFLGVRAYVRLYEKFLPEFPGQSMQQYVNGNRARSGISPGAALAAYFADTDQWLLAAGGPPGLQLPDYKRRSGAAPSTGDAEALKQEKVRVYYSALGIINGLGAQFESTRRR